MLDWERGNFDLRTANLTGNLNGNARWFGVRVRSLSISFIAKTSFKLVK
jgi:hypothetical protein